MASFPSEIENDSSLYINQLNKCLQMISYKSGGYFPKPIRRLQLRCKHHFSCPRLRQANVGLFNLYEAFHVLKGFPQYYLPFRLSPRDLEVRLRSFKFRGNNNTTLTFNE